MDCFIRDFRAVRSDVDFQSCLVTNNVWRISSIDATVSEEGHLVGIDLPADNTLQSNHGIASYKNRINSISRGATVATSGMYPNFEDVSASKDMSGCCSYHSSFDIHNVLSEHSIWLGNIIFAIKTIVYHCLRSSSTFLIRLEDANKCALPFLSGSMQQSRSSRESCHVHIIAACMHDWLVISISVLHIGLVGII